MIVEQIKKEVLAEIDGEDDLATVMATVCASVWHNRDYLKSEGALLLTARLITRQFRLRRIRDQRQDRTNADRSGD